MTSSQTTMSLISSLNNLSNLLNRYVPIFIYIFGIIGNFLNVLVLGQRQLRCSSSAFCFLISSFASLLVILSDLTSRMMSGYAADLTLTIDWICQLRKFILYFGRTIALWMIALAAIDRWLASHTNDRLRRCSNLKNIHNTTFIIVIYACFINVPYIFCYKANVNGALRGCYGSTYACRVWTDLSYVVGTTTIPLMLMVIFGAKTISNIRQSRIRIETMNASAVNLTKIIKRKAKSNGQRIRQNPQCKKRDRHLLKMLIIQIILLVLFTCPHPIQKLYASILDEPSSKSPKDAIENLIFDISSLLSFVSSGMPFYIYTLTGGNLYRTAVFNLLRVIFQNLCRCRCTSTARW